MVVDKKYYFALALIKCNGSCFIASEHISTLPGWKSIPCDNCFNTDNSGYCIDNKKRVLVAKEYVLKVTTDIVESE